MSSPKGWA